MYHTHTHTQSRAPRHIRTRKRRVVQYPDNQYALSLNDYDASVDVPIVPPKNNRSVDNDNRRWKMLKYPSTSFVKALLRGSRKLYLNAVRYFEYGYVSEEMKVDWGRFYFQYVLFQLFVFVCSMHEHCYRGCMSHILTGFI